MKAEVADLARALLLLLSGASLATHEVKYRQTEIWELESYVLLQSHLLVRVIASNSALNFSLRM